MLFLEPGLVEAASEQEAQAGLGPLEKREERASRPRTGKFPVKSLLNTKRYINPGREPGGAKETSGYLWLLWAAWPPLSCSGYGSHQGRNGTGGGVT